MHNAWVTTSFLKRLLLSAWVLAAVNLPGCKELDQQVPHAVFDVGLPKALEANPGPARDLGIVVVVSLSGKGGGDWTVDLHKPEVRKGVATKADLRLHMSVTDFALATRAQLDIPAALKSKRVVVEGNVELLSSFFRLLGGGGK